MIDLPLLALILIMAIAVPVTFKIGIWWAGCLVFEGFGFRTTAIVMPCLITVCMLFPLVWFAVLAGAIISVYYVVTHYNEILTT